jgi:hypothetical protein
MERLNLYKEKSMAKVWLNLTPVTKLSGDRKMSTHKPQEKRGWQALSIEARLETAKKLLAQLKSAYGKLTPKHQEVVRLTLVEVSIVGNA